MPIRHRRSKVRTDDLPAWAMTFQSGKDYFDDLEAAGVQVDAYGHPPRDVAREAWKRLGGAFLEHYRDRWVEPWALIEFGEPGVRRRRRS